MGMYASAKLFYGYIFDEDVELFDEDNEDCDMDGIVRNVAISRGHIDPWDDFPETDAMGWEEAQEVAGKWQAERKEDLDVWHQTLREIDKSIPVDISRYGHYDYPRYYLAIKGTEVTGSPSVPVALGDIPTLPEWKEQLDRFIEEYGFDKPEGYNQPGWFMVASYS